MIPSNSITVIGAGGYSKVVISVLQLLGYRINCIYDDDTTKHGHSILGVKIKGNVDEITKNGKCDAFIAIGNNGIRKKISEKYSNSCNWISIIHPSAILYPNVKIGKGSFIRANVVIQVDAQIGEHCMISSNSTVSHDCILGSFCYLAPNCAIGGQSTLGTGVMLGIGSTVNNDLQIGDWTVIGSQAAVIRNVPPYKMAAGVPAIIKKDLKV